MDQDVQVVMLGSGDAALEGALRGRGFTLGHIRA
jgi:hypothetical protein